MLFLRHRAQEQHNKSNASRQTDNDEQSSHD